MAYVTLSKLSWTAKETVLKLRLLHTWKAGNPTRPDGFYEHSTLWTDETGMLVQGLAAKQLSAHLQEVLAVGKIYFVSQFSQREARKHWAACSNDRFLYFNSNTSFVSSPDDDSAFCLDSFEFRQIEDLQSVASHPSSLIDILGRVVSATPISYSQKQNRTIRRKTVVIENERGCSLSITLWDDFAERLPLADLIQMDGAAPDVVGRLLSVSEEETCPYMMPTISAVLEDSGGNTVVVKYTALDRALSQASIIAAERSGPIIIAFTSMMVVELEDSENLCLVNTAGTRIIHGRYSHRFIHIRNTFSHVHRPVSIGHVPAQNPVYVQYKLSHKTTFLQLLSAKATSCSTHRDSVWCLITIKGIHTYTSICHYHPDTTHYPRFRMNVECLDITTSCNLLFNNDAASSLLQKTAREYVSLDGVAAAACIDSVVGKVFTAEIGPRLETDPPGSLFEVITLWDPLLFAIGTTCHCGAFC